MKIVKIHGGLGNQMFEYAFARSLAVEAGSEVFLDIQTDGPEQAHKGYELGHLFEISLPLAKEADVERLAVRPTTTLNRLRRKYLTKRTHFIDRKYRYQGELFTRQGDAYYEGYWQSEKYFGRVEAELRREFTFRPSLDEENLAILEALPRPRASVHVRRDDYAGHTNLDICTAEYYGRAVGAMREGGTASFAVFSDDIDYCRKALDFGNSEVAFIDRNQGKRSWQDMAMMALCEGHVIANSSFSWWGAWLDPRPGRRVIAPAVWNRRELRRKNHYYDFSFGDIVPETWQRIAP